MAARVIYLSYHLRLYACGPLGKTSSDIFILMRCLVRRASDVVVQCLQEMIIDELDNWKHFIAAGSAYTRQSSDVLLLELEPCAPQGQSVPWCFDKFSSSGLASVRGLYFYLDIIDSYNCLSSPCSHCCNNGISTATSTNINEKFVLSGVCMALSRLSHVAFLCIVLVGFIDMRAVLKILSFTVLSV